MASNLESLLKTQQVIKVSQFYSYKFNISKMSKMTVKTTNNELGRPVVHVDTHVDMLLVAL